MPLAGAINVSPRWAQVSLVAISTDVTNPFNLFKDLLEQIKALDRTNFPPDMIKWMQELDIYLERGVILGVQNVFFRRVAAPIDDCRKAFDKGDYSKALKAIERCTNDEWKLLIKAWLEAKKKEGECLSTVSQ
jgi:hypothetical protein